MLFGIKLGMIDIIASSIYLQEINCMIKNKQLNWIDFQQLDLADILLKIEQSGKPLIITREDIGVAAILPFIDPD